MVECLEPKNIVKTCTFNCNGHVLLLEITQEMLERVQQHFNVATATDDHVFEYFVGAVRSARDKL